MQSQYKILPAGRDKVIDDTNLVSEDSLFLMSAANPVTSKGRKTKIREHILEMAAPVCDKLKS